MSALKNIYEYQDYKTYLLKFAQSQPRGFRKDLAHALNCQTAYVSHVFNGEAHFSLEQAEALARFINLTPEETSYLMRLIEFTRAGTPQLKKFISRELAQLREKHLLIKDRVAVKDSLSREDQAIYYSAWYYAAIHVALTIPALTTREALCHYFRLSSKTVTEVLEFLVSVGLATQSGVRYQIGTKQIHLEKDSPLISKHHTNWRMQAVRALEQMKFDELHFSSVFTLTDQDAQNIREILVKAIESAVGIVKVAKEEKLFAMALDLFEV